MTLEFNCCSKLLIIKTEHQNVKRIHRLTFVCTNYSGIILSRDMRVNKI